MVEYKYVQSTTKRNTEKNRANQNRDKSIAVKHKQTKKKKKKKKECIAKWTKANCKNANQKKTESIPNWKNVQ